MPTYLIKTELQKTVNDQGNRRLFMKKMVGLFGASTALAVLSGCSKPETDTFTAQGLPLSKNGTLFTGSTHICCIQH